MRPDRQSTRLKWYDYHTAGYYAITICTRDRDHAFGEIKAERMCFNDVGRIARTIWYSLPDRFPGVRLDSFVLMPNHLHGIVIIPPKRLNVENMPTRFQPSMRGLIEEHHPELQDYEPPSLGEIIRQYKGATTYRIHRSGVRNFGWHTRYWASIILTETSLQRVRRYIYDNPLNWEKDRLYKKLPERSGE
ncbi:MAG: transposase [Ktedonobacteraceae bacterium]